MANTATDDQLTTEIRLKQRAFTAIAPQTEAEYYTWSNRFDSFRARTLREDIKQTPNNYQIERFIDGIVRHINGRKAQNDGSVVTIRTLKQAATVIVKHCHFTDKDFKYRRNHKLHIESTITQLSRRASM
ncbi:hypothetical protein VTK56DRAFT_3780 [Thermocarpiscus australiensis]